MKSLNRRPDTAGKEVPMSKRNEAKLAYFIDTEDSDYFLHYAGMRNTPKMKALRSKFGLKGYGIWNMLLERLAAAPGHKIKYSTEVDKDLLIGDLFGEHEEVDRVIQYLVKIRSLRFADGFIHSVENVLTKLDL